MDLLQIGLTGLNTSRTNLKVTGHNISNLDTPGYTRQRTEQLTNTPLYKGYGAQGTGAKTHSIERIIDDYMTKQLRTDTSRETFSKEFLTNISELDNLVSGKHSMANAFNKFFAAIQATTEDGQNKANRELVITSAENIVKSFRAINNKLNDQNNSINGRVKIHAEKINKIAKDIAQLNSDIVDGYMRGNKKPPNDLLDLREERLRELSELVDVQAVLQDGMEMNVSIGNGQALVIGKSAYQLEAAPGKADASRWDLSLVGKGGKVNVVNQHITGGKLGALLRYREEVLDPSFNKLGRIATVFSAEINKQHARGVDTQDMPGGNMFADINAEKTMLSRIKPIGGRNTDSGGSLKVEITNTAALQAAEYNLRVQDGKFVIRDKNGKLLDWKKVPANHGVVDFSKTLGFKVHVPGSAQEGDQWQVMPTRFGTEQIKNEITDINKLALRGIGAPKENTGTAKFSYIDGNFGPMTPFGAQITYKTPTGGTGPQFDLVDKDGNAFVPPPTITVDGNKITFEGVPAAHKFTVEYKGSPKEGDKWILEGKTGQSAANLLAAVQRTKTINSATGLGSSITESYSQYVEFIGNTTDSYKISHSTNESVLKQTKELQSRISGVNMDEEAANILKFQQAYQAAAQVMATAQTIFNAVLSIKGY